MSIQSIKFGGEEFPISFNLNVLSDFFSSMGLSLNDLEQLNNLTLTQIRTLTYLAVSEGYRLMGEQMPYSSLDIFAQMNMDDISKVAELFANSLTPDNTPKSEEVEGNGKKPIIA